MTNQGRLSEDEICHYHQHGYVIPDFRLSAETLESIRLDHSRLLADNPDRPEFRDNCPALLNYDEAFLDYADNPAILAMVNQLIGPDVALWNMSFFAKPARDGKRTPWHQDGEYWPIRPLANCTVWIAVDDATTNNGCMRFIPGSHRPKRLLEHTRTNADDVTLNLELEQHEYDEQDAVDVVLEAGQISLHDVYLVHGSAPNTSGRPRRAMTLRLIPTTSVFDRALAAEMHHKRGGVNLTDRSIYLMSGVDQSGRNDLATPPRTRT